MIEQILTIFARFVILATSPHDLGGMLVLVVCGLRCGEAPAAARAKLPGLVAFGRIVRERRVDGKPAQRWTHYYALSRRLTPEQLASLVRGHGGIENHLHWPLDVIFDEVASRFRKNFAPENWAVLRTIARNMLEADPEDIPIRKRMKKAPWSKHALFNLFAHVR